MKAKPQKAVTVEVRKIKEKKAEKEKCFVKPAKIKLHRGEDVRFYMPPKVDATLMFPYPIFDIQMVHLNMSNKWRVDLKVKPDVPKGEYPYCIFCHKGADFAEGESPPKVIIVDNGP